MAFKYEDGKVIQVSPPHVTGEDAQRMLNAKVPRKLVEKILKKKFITINEPEYKIDKTEIIDYLKKKKEELYQDYGITTLGLYGSYARDEATDQSDIDIFYERDQKFELKSGLEFLSVSDKLADDLDVDKVDFVSLESMNPIIKHYAKKDFIYV